MIRYKNDLRRELEALKKKAEGVFKPAGAVPLEKTRPSGALDELVPGRTEAYEGGEFYRVLAGAGGIWEDADKFHGEYLETLSSPFTPEAPVLNALKLQLEVPPEKVCYLDLETTGLSMCPLFLVGLMYVPEDGIVVDQLFARDYTEEATVLRFLKKFLGDFSVIVTFNGRSFDLPFIVERMAFSGIDFTPPSNHIDLLPLARSFIKNRTPNHRLQTLERYLCKRKRIGDVPGREIPDVYHEFVRTGEAGGIAGVFHHNRLDLLTMLQLVTFFLSLRV